MCPSMCGCRAVGRLPMSPREREMYNVRLWSAVGRKCATVVDASGQSGDGQSKFGMPLWIFLVIFHNRPTRFFPFFFFFFFFISLDLDAHCWCHLHSITAAPLERGTRLLVTRAFRSSNIRNRYYLNTMPSQEPITSMRISTRSSIGNWNRFISSALAGARLMNSAKEWQMNEGDQQSCRTNVLSCRSNVFSTLVKIIRYKIQADCAGRRDSGDLASTVLI